MSMDADHIRELFSQFRPVEVRRMFGGAGIIADGLTFAIVFEGVVYLRIDRESIPEFKEEGSKPFVYPYAKHMRRRDPEATPFWRMPERLYDDPEEAARFAGRALEVARRKKAVKPKTVKPKAAKSKAAPAKQPAKKPVAKAIAARKKASKPKKPAKSPARRTVAAKRSSR